MEVYLIRHGQSVNNAVMGDLTRRVEDAPLTETGRRQAEYVAHHLKHGVNLETLVSYGVDAPERGRLHSHELTHLYTSPMRRALQTTQPIALALKLQPQIWIDIHEHGGLWMEIDGVRVGRPGMSRKTIKEQFPEYALPETGVSDAGWWFSDGEEDIHACYARATRVAETLLQRAAHPDSQHDTIALVSHGTFLDTLLKAFYQVLPGSGFVHWHYNTATTRLDLWPNGRVVLRYVNRVTHLPAELVT